MRIGTSELTSSSELALSRYHPRSVVLVFPVLNRETNHEYFQTESAASNSGKMTFMYCNATSGSLVFEHANSVSHTLRPYLNVKIKAA